MYNDKNRQMGVSCRASLSQRQLSGRSCPTFSSEQIGGRSDIPSVDDRIGKRLCDGTLPENTQNGEGCGNNDGGWGLRSHPLAMVYSPLQEFRELYTPDVALDRGTLFAELDLPFEGDNGKKGGCCL